MKFTYLIWFLLVLTNLSSCDNKSIIDPYSYTELAMKPGMRVEATNKNGKVVIEYISPLKRRFIWQGNEEVRTLIPREKRWMGMLGAYDPASKYFWEFWKPSKRVVAEDSQLHFNSMYDIKKWLYQSSEVLDWVYTNDGLVVGFAQTSERNQVNIEIYQLYLNGIKPSQLDGAQPQNIKIQYQ